ncbi:probable transcriptional regulator [Fulvimarina pelagi HTCC2506]|uniref:Probable transcriptional regulator n=1 Tax=Fulvimarina pelagi HTCC2506 TaxID=314231 RepID=Q0G2R0_9HYPH|nr:AAA family ATPase [Fulvimarina pelagi]EAU42121.1 probable transcriptional regulator [Fulvimarina pelagi HTCC2506]
MTWSLDLLGGFALRSEAGDCSLNPRKGRALLAMLALARNGVLTRSQVASVLWEVSDIEQARSSLRQTLAQIRRAVGPGLVEGDTETVRLGQGVTSDIALFRQAAADGEMAEAARHYRGELLEGHVFRERAIEDYLALERTRLRDIALSAFLAELHRIGERPEAAPIAHRLLAIDPLQEAAHRRLMALDAAKGDGAAALSRFRMLKERLHRDLDVAPEAETTQLFDAIRNRRSHGASSQGGEALPAGSDQPSAHLRQVIVLAGFDAGEDTNGGSDWARRMAECAESDGARLFAENPGEMLVIFGLDRTSDRHAEQAATIALDLAAAHGEQASFGLAEETMVIGEKAGTSRVGMRALRLAAATEPGSVALDRRLASRLGIDPAASLAVGQNGVLLEHRVTSTRPKPPFVGRQQEIAQIVGAIRSSAEEESGLTIHVTGEAGIGKTRLIEEAITQISAENIRCVSMSFSAFGSATTSVPHRIAEALTGDGEVDPPCDPHDQAIFADLRGAPLTPSETLRLSAMVPAERRRRELNMLGLMLRRSGGRSGALLVVEDCHWAGLGALDFLLDLTDMTSWFPLCIVLTERSGEASLAPRIAARGQASLIRIALAPLPPKAADLLAGSIASTSEEHRRQAVEKAAGHPLFLLRLLEDGWREGSLPATVTSLVQEQIERLPEEIRTALRQASVLGRIVDPAAYRAIFPASPLPTPTGDLMIRSGDELAFGHDLVQQAIYHSVPPDIRKVFHGRAAAYYRGVSPLPWADHALLSDDAADGSRAAAAAASAMIASRRFAAATTYIEAGLALDADPEVIAEIYSCRAGTRRIRGDLNGALQDYRSAFGKATRDETRIAMLVRMALVFHRLDRGAEADRALSDAEEIADTIGLGGIGRAEIHEQRGNRAFVRADYLTCFYHHQTALKLVEPVGDVRALARAYGGMGDATYVVGRIRSAYGFFDKAVTIAEENGLGMVLEEFGFMRAYALHLADPGPKAFILSDLALNNSCSSGAARAEMLARQTRAEMRLNALDVEGAAEDLARLDQLLESDPERRFATTLDVLHILFCHRTGDIEEARRRLHPHLVGAKDDTFNGGFLLGLSALVLPDEAERRTMIEAGRRLVAWHSASHSVLWFHRLVLEHAVNSADDKLAREAIEALQDYTKDEPLGWTDLAIATAEAAMDGRTGGDLTARREATMLHDLVHMQRK